MAKATAVMALCYTLVFPALVASTSASGGEAVSLMQMNARMVTEQERKETRTQPNSTAKASDNVTASVNAAKEAAKVVKPEKAAIAPKKSEEAVSTPPSTNMMAKTDKSLKAKMAEKFDAMEKRQDADKSALDLSKLAKEELEAVMLPEVPEVASKSEGIINSMMMNISALKTRLREESKGNSLSAMAAKAAYQQNLTIQKQRIEALLAQKAATSAANDALTNGNAQLRGKAAALKRENGQLEARLKELQVNITYASEFVQKAMQETNASAPELEVLDELDAHDARRREAAAKEHALKEVGDSPLSLLAVRSATGDGIAPDDLLRAIGDGVLGARAEDNSTQAEVTKMFEVKFKHSEDAINQLQREEDALEVNQANLKKLKGQLEAAVKHLQDEGSRLKEEVVSAEAFFSKLGSRPLPVSEHAK